MRRRLSRRRLDETSHPADQGATAVIVTVLSALLLSVAALVVDLGIAFTRSAGAESAARGAAVAAGTALAQGGCAAAVTAAVDALNGVNAVTSDVDGGQPVPLTVTAAGMVDGDLTNGELEILGRAEIADEALPDLLLDTTTCRTRPADPGHLVRVWAPSIRVDFRLAGLFGIDATTTTGFAGAELRSDLDILPFAIAEECAAPGQRSFVLEPRTVPSPGHTAAPDALLPGPRATMAMELVDIVDDPDSADDADVRVYYTNPTTAQLWVDFTAISPSGAVENYAVGPTTRVDTPQPDGPGTGYLPIRLPDQVLREGGSWTVRIGDRFPGSTLNFDDGATLVLTRPITGVVDPGTCQGVEQVGVGDLLLITPPVDSGAPDPQAAVRRAVIEGLPEVPATVTLATSSEHASMELAVSESVLVRVMTEDAPCVTAPAGERGHWTVGALTIRATDRPSCYVDDVTLPDGSPEWRVPDPAALVDPRMALIPMVDTDMGTGDPNPWRPLTAEVTGYRFAMVTDETPVTALAGGDPPQVCLPPADAVGCTGITMDGADVDKLTVYVTGLEALPRDVVRVATAGMPWVGGPADVHLVE